MASQEEISRVRRRIGDSEKQAISRVIGDGTVNSVSLEFKNVFNVSVTSNSTPIAPEAYTVHNASGTILFNEPIAENTTIHVEYSYAGYSDDMINELIDNYGVEGAVVEALQELLVDAARLYDYQQGQTTDKRSQIFDHLKSLLESAKTDFIATSTNGVRIGSRHNERRKFARRRIDLSRDDSWSSNNV